jgi:hypothetical protein
VGLIQRLVEEAGIPTISTGNAADRMAHIKFGEPGNVKRQRRIILDALEALQTMTEPGTIQELPYKWKQPEPE